MNASQSGLQSNTVTGYRVRDIWRVPGLLSLCRLPLAIAFPVAYVRPLHAILLMAAAALTDVLDGWVARRFRQQTAMGALLDGLMDKIFGASVLATLVVGHVLWLSEALVLSTREIGEGLLIAFSLWLRPRPPASERSANTVGKLATVLQFTTIVLVLLDVGPRPLFVYATGGCGVLAATTYWAREFGSS